MEFSFCFTNLRYVGMKICKKLFFQVDTQNFELTRRKIHQLVTENQNKHRHSCVAQTTYPAQALSTTARAETSDYKLDRILHPRKY